MKSANINIWMLAVLPMLFACGGGGQSNTANSTTSAELTSFEDSLCYAFGNYTAKDLRKNGVDMNASAFQLGIEDEQSGKSYLSEDGMYSCFQHFTMELRSRQGQPATADNPLQTNVDTLSYAIGKNLVFAMNKGEVAVNALAVINGVQDYYGDKESKMTDSQIETIMRTYNTRAREKQNQQNAIEKEKNLTEGKAFLEENAKKEGVVTTGSGLQYRILREGKGPKPSATDQVSVNYEGRLLNSDVFDSSYDRGAPIDFPLNGVIRGWTEGLQLMSPGAKYRFFIPADLAYGDRGSPPKIKPGATLIFDVELLEIK